MPTQKTPDSVFAHVYRRLSNNDDFSGIDQKRLEILENKLGMRLPHVVRDAVVLQAIDKIPRLWLTPENVLQKDEHTGEQNVLPNMALFNQLEILDKKVFSEEKVYLEVKHAVQEFHDRMLPLKNKSKYQNIEKI